MTAGEDLECELHDPEGESVQCWVSAFQAAQPLLERCARARRAWTQLALF